MVINHDKVNPSNNTSPNHQIFMGWKMFLLTGHRPKEVTNEWFFLWGKGVKKDGFNGDISGFNGF